MYKIVRTGSTFEATCQLQDGHETKPFQTENDAVYWLITMARICNGDYISKCDIEITVSPPAKNEFYAVNPQERRMLDDINRGALKVIDGTSKMIRMKLTDEELEAIIALREGRATLNMVPGWSMAVPHGVFHSKEPQEC